MTSLLLGMLAAFMTSWLLTPVVRRAALAWNLVDQPDATRKMHQHQTPLGGGVAVLLATLVGVGTYLLAPAGEIVERAEPLVEDPFGLAGLLGAALIICLVGLADDCWGMRARKKLLGQALAVSVVIASGLVIRSITLFGWQIDLGLLAVPFTLFWLLGAINALNLIDGADGLASTIGIILCASIAALAVYVEQPSDAAVAAALAGALAGFLIFNFPPATIFLGDTGSMLIGLVVGTLAIRGSFKGPATVALAAPMAILAIPIFDSVAAVVRRRMTGRSIYSSDRGHLHHVLLKRGLSSRGTLLLIGLLCAATAAGGLASVYLKNELCAVLSALTIAGTLIVSRVFGFVEFKLLTNRARALGESLTRPRRARQLAREQHVRLQGSHNWSEIWSSLTVFAEEHELSRVQLTMNLPWLHECYHAVWEQADFPNAEELWSTSMPVVAQYKTLGHLEIAGPLSNHAGWQLLTRFAELLRSLEPALIGLLDEVADAPLETRPARLGEAPLGDLPPSTIGSVASRP